VANTAATYPASQGLAAPTTPRVGYFPGFVGYWVGWCLAFPRPPG
jgi:hypothetical protein